MTAYGCDFRILVTGSRSWTDYRTIVEALETTMGSVRLYHPDTRFVIVHGHCPKGADAMADRYGVEHRLTVERHPAQWQAFGKSAGFKRNSHMVSLGADTCLAFIKNRSAGASMTARLAEEAGILTWRYLA